MPAKPMATAYTGSQYGAVELKRMAQKYWGLGLCIAIGIHMLIVGTYYAVALVRSEEPPVMSVRIMKYSDLGPPPSITTANTPPPIAAEAPKAKPTVGMPVPVPDAEVSAEQTIATQAEMSQTVAPIAENAGANDVVQQDIRIDDDTPPADFVPVEKEPQQVKSIRPKYPDLAMRAGLEGKVWVKIWVDKEGKPKKAIVLKSDADIFNEPSVDAAMQSLFTPAYMNNGPVAVWVVIPFTFRLTGKQ